MGKKKHKKSGKEDKTLERIILITATLNLIKMLMDIIQSLID